MKTIVLCAVLASTVAVCSIATARPVSTAESHCIITGATGYGKSTRSPEDAVEKAVAACIGKGGVPECCRKGARPL